jgi:hypothetical protein
MTVFAFGGGVTSPQKLQRGGVVIFDAMSQLPELLTDP